MNLKRVFFILTTVIILIISFVSCATDIGSSGSDSVTSNLPSGYKLNIPDSLTSGGDTQAGVSRTTRAGMASYGYMELQNVVSMMKQSSSMYGQLYIMTDVAITDLTPDNTTLNKNITIVFTQDMVNKIKALDPDVPTDSLPMVGDTVVMPDFYYATGDFSSLIDTTIDITGYTNLVKFDYADLMGATSGVTAQLYILWTSTAVKIVDVYKDETVGDDYKVDFSYDTVQKLSTMVMADTFQPYIDDGMGGWTQDPSADPQIWLMSVTMQEKNSAKSGVMIDMFDKSEGEGYKYEYYISGYADDDGGYIETKYIYEDMSITGPDARDAFKYKEQFDGNGNLTGAQYYDPTTGQWMNDDTIGTWSDTSYDDTYAQYDDTFDDDPNAYNDYLNPDETVIKVQLPTLTFGSDYVKDFAITAQGVDPTGASGWDNVIGSFSIFDDEYTSGMTVDAYLWGTATNYDLHLITDLSADQIKETTKYSLTLTNGVYVPQ